MMVADMKKLVRPVWLLFPLLLCINSQSSDGQKQMPALTLDHELECGSPLVESMLWMSVEGNVIKVIDGDSIILLTKGNERSV
jgi:hypothetical protein